MLSIPIQGKMSNANVLKHLPHWEWTSYPILTSIQEEIRTVEISSHTESVAKTMKYDLLLLASRAHLLSKRPDKSSPRWLAECGYLVDDCAVQILHCRYPHLPKYEVAALLEAAKDTLSTDRKGQLTKAKGRKFWSKTIDRTLKSITALKSAGTKKNDDPPSNFYTEKKNYFHRGGGGRGGRGRGSRGGKGRGGFQKKD